jgi:predicted 2-oxoglutarate/Fe(II)-dependent dioxygenase YbiX
MLLKIQSIEKRENELRQNGTYFGVKHLLEGNLLQQIENIFWENFILSTKENKNNFNLIFNGHVRMYTPGAGISPHTDEYFFGKNKSDMKYPDYTALLYFNNNYEGGELGLPDYNILFKPTPGSFLIFPKNTTHEVKDILSGNRYIAMAFFVKKD